MNKALRSRFNKMKERCYNKNSKSYERYGGRGIYICDEWLNDPELFEKWSIENGFEKGLAIDRIDNDGPYSPDNCRYVTLKENNQNRRSSKWYTINGETKNLQQWCDFYNIKRSTVVTRLENGWPIEKALSEPVASRERDRESLIGMRFFRLAVIGYAGDEFIGKDNNSRWICKCECGNEIIVSTYKLKSGHTKSCGCLVNDTARERMLNSNPMKTEEQRKRMRENNPMKRR